ncbi:hypothetical protein PIB30_003755 [Stylosanthes scabra]|uniref:Uncharacterized protein n=1 Tax=Stylosanthes scabra TaxID=79078 RepID=A0ABU6R2C2_9FABA|nr:hypothetical protein [Stylosanthes scabra]
MEIEKAKNGEEGNRETVIRWGEKEEKKSIEANAFGANGDQSKRSLLSLSAFLLLLLLLGATAIAIRETEGMRERVSGVGIRKGSADRCTLPYIAKPTFLFEAILPWGRKSRCDAETKQDRLATTSADPTVNEGTRSRGRKDFDGGREWRIGDVVWHRV